MLINEYNIYQCLSYIKVSLLKLVDTYFLMVYYKAPNDPCALSSTLKAHIEDDLVYRVVDCHPKITKIK